MFTVKKTFACHTCHQIGHFSRNCPQKSKKKAIKSKFHGNKKGENVLFASLFANNANSMDWYIDSGATSHMTMNASVLVNKKTVTDKEVVCADNSKLKVNCAGDMKMLLNNGTDISKATFKDVTYVPNLCTNLISVSRMASNGNKVEFENDTCEIYNKNRDVIGTASLVNGLYRLNCEIDKTEQKSEVVLLANDDHELWHRRLGHICDANLDKVKNSSNGIKFGSKKDEQCIVCVKGKQTRKPFKDVGKRAKNLLDLMHSDLCGPFEIASHSGARYLFTIVDDYSRKVFIFPLKKKSEVVTEFKKFKSLVENQCERKIKVFRTDNGKEYVNNGLGDFLAKNGIKHEKTAPYTPEQNGVAERINRSIVERVRCMLVDAGLNKKFWAEAAVTTGYLLNRIPCRGNSESPEERWTNEKQNLSHIKVFGCKAMVHVPKEKRRKLDAKSNECILMGYSTESKAYRLFDPKTHKIVVSRDVIFVERNTKVIENEIKTNPSLSSIVLTFGEELVNANSGEEAVVELDIDSSVADDSLRQGPITVPVSTAEQGEDSLRQGPSALDNDSVSNEENIEANNSADDTLVNSSNETSTSLDESVYDDTLHDLTYMPDESTEVLDEIRQSIRTASMPRPDYRPPTYSFNVAEVYTGDPLTYDEAVYSGDSALWKNAMKNEIASLKSNETWDLVDLPPGKKPICCKWVFKTKRDANGKVEKHKARLVAKGFTQVEGVDYKETFAPVVRYTTIRYLLAIAAKLQLRIQQMDAVTAFLNGELSEEIYMRQPKGFEDGTKHVCKLKKALYGLKQSSRVWNQCLNQTLLNFGLKRSEVDQCVYYRHDGNKILIVSIYVDDLLIFSNDETLERQLKSELSKRFEMKDMGEASSVLGVRITHNKDDNSIAIDQSHYVTEVLKRFGMIDCNPISTPLDPNSKQLTSNACPTDPAEIEEMSKKPYQQAIGCLLYAAQITRPDISFVVNLLSRYRCNPGKAHWLAVKRVMRYLKGTINMRIVYQHRSSEVISYCDADYAGNIDTKQTTTGYVFLFQDAAISWNSKLQKRVTLSSTESEYVAMVAAAKESIWFKQLEQELFPSSPKLMTLYCDNKSAMEKANNNAYSEATKHVDIKLKFLHQRIAKGEIELRHVPTQEMLADALTKGVSKIKLDYFCQKLGLNNV